MNTLHPFFEQLDEVPDVLGRQVALPDGPHVEIETCHRWADRNDDNILMGQIEHERKQGHALIGGDERHQGIEALDLAGLVGQNSFVVIDLGNRVAVA